MTGTNGTHYDIGLEFLELNTRYAYVIENGKSVIFREDRNAQGHIDITRMSVMDFKSAMSNKVAWTGTKPMQMGKFWIEHPDRRTFESCGFDPNPERAHDPNFYNLFQGLPITPAPGDWSRFRQHLLEVGCDNDEETFEFVLNWMKLLVQSPHLMPGVAIVLQGRQGTGKGLIVRWLGKLVGKHFRHVSSVRHVVGHFNAHLEDVLLLFADEAVWAGDKQSEGALKSLVTEPTLLLERKGRDAYTAKNYTHLIIATNSEWAAPMEASDRRFVVVNTPDTYCGNVGYFTAISEQMSNGGIEAMMWDLANGHVDFPLRKPRSVSSIESSWRQQEQGLPGFHTWLLVRLQNGQLFQKHETWTDPILKTDIYNDYLVEMKDRNLPRRDAMNIFAKNIHQIIPGILEPRLGQRADRQRYWKMPSLETCREAFARHFQKPSAAMFPPEIPDTDD